MTRDEVQLVRLVITPYPQPKELLGCLVHFDLRRLCLCDLGRVRLLPSILFAFLWMISDL